MSTTLFAIAKNTFTETLRQPVYAVIIISSLLLILLAPSISMYTLDEDIKILRELALSTLFLSGLFISVFSATGAITEELESGTVTTVISKPIPRPVFILGKFCGVCMAVGLAHFLISAAMIMATRHGVIETAADTHDWTVITAAAVTVLSAISISTILNYFYDKSFLASAIITAVIFASISLLFLAVVDKEWKVNPANNQFSLFDIYASILILFAVYVIVALAIMFSTRMNVVLTLSFCISLFLLGLISDWIFGRIPSWEEIFVGNKKYILWTIDLCFVILLFFGVSSILAAQSKLIKSTVLLGLLAASFLSLFFTGSPFFYLFGKAVIPNFQVFWVSDAIYETGKIPIQYIGMALSYSTCYILGILALAVAFFQRRQVG